MSETKTSQVRETQGAWKKMVDDHLARVELACGELTRMQEQALAQNRRTVDEMADPTAQKVLDRMKRLGS